MLPVSHAMSGRALWFIRRCQARKLIVVLQTNHHTKPSRPASPRKSAESIALSPALVHAHLLHLNSRRYDPGMGVWVRSATFAFSPDSRRADSAIVDGQCPADWLRSAQFRFLIPDGLASFGAFRAIDRRSVGFARRVFRSLLWTLAASCDRLASFGAFSNRPSYCLHCHRWVRSAHSLVSTRALVRLVFVEIVCLTS